MQLLRDNLTLWTSDLQESQHQQQQQQAAAAETKTGASEEAPAAPEAEAVKADA